MSVTSVDAKCDVWTWRTARARRSAREKARLLPVEAAADGGDEGDGQRARERRQEAPDVDDAVVRREPVAARRRREERRHGLRQVEGERAVREEVRVELERAEGELEDRVADRALVRVEEVVLVEIEAVQPDGERGRHHREQEPSRGRRTLSHCSGPDRLPERRAKWRARPDKLKMA